MHENSHFLLKIILKCIQKRINRKCFQKISSRELPHSKRVSEIFIFYIKNGRFLNFYIRNRNLKKNIYKKWYFSKFFKVKI